MLPARPPSSAARVAWDVSEQGQALLAVLFPHTRRHETAHVIVVTANTLMAISARPGAPCPARGTVFAGGQNVSSGTFCPSIAALRKPDRASSSHVSACTFAKDRRVVTSCRSTRREGGP